MSNSDIIFSICLIGGTLLLISPIFIFAFQAGLIPGLLISGTTLIIFAVLIAIQQD